MRDRVSNLSYCFVFGAGCTQCKDPVGGIPLYWLLPQRTTRSSLTFGPKEKHITN